MPGLDGMGKSENGQDEGQDHHGSLGNNQEHSPRQAVCYHPTEEGK